MNKKIIFDIGANNGQNLEYYLCKADTVIAVEPNKNCIKKIKDKFHQKIADKSLYVEECAISKKKKLGNFYINKSKSVLSQIDKPKENNNKFTKIKIKHKTIKELINKYQKKIKFKKIYLIKIDIEHHDYIILDQLFNNKILPTYLSAEIQNPQALIQILKSPYKFFSIIDGINKNTTIKIKSKNSDKKVKKIISEIHSAGPFGDELRQWYNKEQILAYFLNNGLGWIDICCTNEKKQIHKNIFYDQNVHRQGFRYHIRKLIPSFINMLMLKFIKIKNKL